MTSLEEQLGQGGFSPQPEQGEQLLTLLGDADRQLARAAERALLRLGRWGVERVAAQLPSAHPPLRGRLCRLLGRLAGATGDAAIAATLLERIEDPDLKTRRSAIMALGKLGAIPGLFPRLEERLLARWPAALELAEQRSLVEALGKVGGVAALALLRQTRSSDPELHRLLEEARLKLERTLGRATPGRIDPQRVAPRPLTVRFHCRAGLERVLAEELSAELGARPRPPGRVEARWAGSLERLQAARTALRFVFPLPSRELSGDEDLAVAVAEALCGPACRELLQAFTEGPIRFRLEWAGAGHRRAQSFRVAAEVARRSTELQNDPTRCLWEVRIRGTAGSPPQGEPSGSELPDRPPRRLELELWPRGLPDPRFSYRRREVPAASHPTVAAALARLAGVRDDDVCWDPFVGSGLELCERGLLGPYQRLLGSDLEATALEAAHANLTAAGLQRFELALGDARQHRPGQRPSLIITNPPMGRRLLRGEELEPLLERFLRHAARQLLASGRMVWINPLEGGGLPLLRAAGLSPELQQRIDMGGFHAELQVLRHAAPR